ncbi:molecular chaperone Tir [Paratractidigestivibacter sp.]|uniref:molecular chaperone Tir n=1 Tax=Paratractidigestivibacter sp. TaxID=2847316 RepID=UPI002AC91ADD|nr:molecular chaperone Tir [Paratractidigestivibacter sp.]
MAYRTRTYIAGDWTGDSDLIGRLYEWNDGDYWGLHFNDAHELTQARDTSLNCSIKSSLRERLDCSKAFVLVVGESTLGLRAGSCAYCRDYGKYYQRCCRGRHADLRSYVEYECDYAAEHIEKIVVLYNYASVHREKCPEALRYEGLHLPAYRMNGDRTANWCYQDIKRAICG